MIDLKEKYYLIALWAMIALYVGIFFDSSLVLFNNFRYDDMDLAVYDQVMWNILHGQLYNSVLGINFLGHHAHFLAFPLALVYLLFPHPSTLLFIQTLALGLAAFPLYLLARRQVASRWALIIGALYLSYPALGCINIYEFHFTPLATLSLMSACYFFFEKKYLPFQVSMLLTLLCQENMPLPVFAFGVYAMIQKRPKEWWLPLMAIAVFYFIFYIYFLAPMLNQNRIQFMSIYGYFGGSFTEILSTIVLHPLFTLSYMFQNDSTTWLVELFFPLGFISFCSPLHLLPAAPLFLQHLLSNRAQETNIKFHYAAELIPFIFVALVFGIRNITKFSVVKEKSAFVMSVLLIFTLISVKDFGPRLPFFNHRPIKDDIAVRQEFVRMVSPQANLVSSFEFMSHLDHRKNLYSFLQIYLGKYILSQQPYQMPDRVDEALINFDDRLMLGSFYQPANYKNIQSLLERYHLVPIAAQDNIVFFKRSGRPALDLYHLLNKIPDDLNSKKPLFAYKGIELKDVQASERDGTLELSMTWRTKAKLSRDINFFVDFLDEDGRVVRRQTVAVCYRIFPTQAWEPGEWVLDHKYLTIPSVLQGARFTVKIGFWDQVTRDILGTTVLENL